MILGDFNAHSSILNNYYRTNQRTDTLEQLIDDYNWILNNDTTIVTRPIQEDAKSIIDLTFTLPDMSLLLLLCIDPDIATPSDHEVIVFAGDILSNSYTTNVEQSSSNHITGLANREMQVDIVKAVSIELIQCSINDMIPNDNWTVQQVERDVSWIEKQLTHVLNRHAQHLKIVGRSKQWLTL